MIIVIGTSDFPRLEDVENFEQFKIVAHATLFGSEDLIKQIGMLGSIDENGNHVWVSIFEFMSLFGSGRSEAWQDNFNKMLDGVAKYGFLNSDGTAFRSHIEAL